jgi:ATP-dependent Clp protease ATP-binding subunit ClpA
MFERFTPGAHSIVVEAQHHARRLGHRYIGTEHLLLALCSSGEPVADVLRTFNLTTASVQADMLRLLGCPSLEPDRAALASLGIDLDRVLQTIEANHGPHALRATTTKPRKLLRRRRTTCAEGERRLGHIPFAARAQKCLELSLREALRLHQSFVAPEHIALGILREGQGLACLVLAQESAQFESVRVALEQSVRPPSGA